MNEQDKTTPSLIEQGYDLVYAAWPKAATLHQIWREHVAGPDYPEGFEHISFATSPELMRLKSVLAVGEGDVLVDLACGAGGSGLWMANAAGAMLTGVDFSAAGIALAAERASKQGMAGSASFLQRSFADTGLPAESAVAVMSLDALQYAPNKQDAFDEIARILKPGGRVGIYSFVLDAATVQDLPGSWEDPVEDCRQPLAHARLSLRCTSRPPAGWIESRRPTQHYRLTLPTCRGDRRARDEHVDV